MINKQIFTQCDSLKLIKENAKKQHPNCAFYTHEINGREIDINTGFIGEEEIREAIITDGKISLQRKNHYSPRVVWENHLVTLNNGFSISITIEEATFMIVVTNRSGDKQVDMHIPNPDRKTIQDIIRFFYGGKQSLFEASSIRFTSPTMLILESATNGTVKQETFDFSLGKEKERQYGKRQYRKMHQRKKH